MFLYIRKQKKFPECSHDILLPMMFCQYQANCPPAEEQFFVAPAILIWLPYKAQPPVQRNEWRTICKGYTLEFPQAVKSLIGALSVMCVFEAMIANNVLHRPLLLQTTHFLLEFWISVGTSISACNLKLLPASRWENYFGRWGNTKKEPEEKSYS